MNRVIIPALTSSTMTPLERAQGRFMRAPDHPSEEGGTGSGGTDSGLETNNTEGNSGDSGNDDKTKDNGGQDDELKGFWEAEPEAPKAGESDDEDKQTSVALGTELKGMIDGFAPKPVFTKEIGEAIAEGNFDVANEALAVAHREAIQASVVAASKLLGAVVTKLQADFDSRINSALGSKDNMEFLKQNFPQAKNPAFAPTVERIWNQSLVNTKGNREEAIRQTRGMLNAMGKDFAPEDVRTPPADPFAGINTDASKSFVDDLLQR